MVFSRIMYLPNYVQLLRNRHRVYNMNALLMEYSIMDIVQWALFLGYIHIILPLREPPRKFITYGVCTYGIAQSTRGLATSCGGS
jgi:hypothetical protein